jgi:hypothetical protein
LKHFYIDLGEIGMNKTNQLHVSITMNKKQAVLTGIALILLLTGITLATSTAISATSDVIIYAFTIPLP